MNTNDILDFSLERGTGTMEILVAFVSKIVSSEPKQPAILVSLEKANLG